MTSNDRLGRGLGALLGEITDGPPVPAAAEGEPSALPVRAIAPNPYQPRKEFSADELTELAASIEANGLLQPVVVRRTTFTRSYELVAGERRLRAAKSLGWKEIPAWVRDVDDKTLLVLSLVENIQREELGPLEEAQGYAALRGTFGFTQEKIAEAVGKSRSTVANVLRLLTLPPSVRRLLQDGSLSMGHARAILAVRDPVQAAELAREAVDGAWSVRETEERARALASDASDGEKPKKRSGRKTAQQLAVAALEEALCSHFDTRVAIKSKGASGRGTIRIDFSDARELERVFLALTGKEAGDIVG